jgi:hypothetical protein
MAMQVKMLNEPLLEFGHGQTLSDPHAGLTVFGPSDLGQPSHLASLRYAVVGPPSGAEMLVAFLNRVRRPVVSCDYAEQGGESKDVRLWPPFPGFEAVFLCSLPPPARVVTVDPTGIQRLVSVGDPHRRAYDLVSLYLEQIRNLAERDEAYSVILCVEPDDIWESCRPKSKVETPVGKKPSGAEIRIRRLYEDLFAEYRPEQYEHSVDFRRQLKARAMEYDIPIQLVRESTLMLREPTEDERRLTCLSDRAWNLCTTLYYKAGGRPWRLACARPGVCYVGLVFRQTDPPADKDTACCAAQMFLDTGDGVVFRGEFGPWYSEKAEEFHLPPASAEALLRGVIETYRAQGGQELNEIFLHSRSTIWREEFDGYQRACPPGAKLVGVRVGRARDEIRLYRPGSWVVQRGMMWQTRERTAYLWASGFKPDLLTYDGWEVPVPLRIDIQHGDADIEQVCRDILGLTKLNYNACKVGDAQPVTVGFSDKVGEILVSNPKIAVRRPSFKFYI